MTNRREFLAGLIPLAAATPVVLGQGVNPRVWTLPDKIQTGLGTFEIIEIDEVPQGRNKLCKYDERVHIPMYRVWGRGDTEYEAQDWMNQWISSDCDRTLIAAKHDSLRKNYKIDYALLVMTPQRTTESKYEPKYLVAREIGVCVGTFDERFKD